jgi:pyruvate dehydrogenase E2 component (dihydrolipoamide acetyltransferase)/2-oxoisovalerate dehydrogenase E2 component (dihydrolipoyl transacylase)
MDFALPEIGEGVYEAELVRWLVKPGDAVRRGQTLAEVLTDKATMELPAPFAGRVTALKAEPGAAVKVGQPLLSYEGEGARAAEAPAKEAVAAARPAVANVNGPPAAQVADRMPVKAAPSVRQMARRLGVDLERVSGSGPAGRVLVEDLAGFVRPAAAEAPVRPSEPRPDYGRPGTRVKLAGLRRRIAEHMALAKRTIPHYSYVDECDVTELVRLRDSLKETFADAGVKLTYLAFFVKAAVAALKEVPLVNASLDETAGEIVLHDRYHIGVAVASPGGLVVPVVRDADRKTLAEIAREVERLSVAVRTGKAKPEELKGGTFTISSVGNIGGLFATPIINHPEVGILGLAKIVRRPVFDDNGQIKPADLMYLSLSFDHRVVDGAVGAAFANAIIKQIQAPATLLLPEKL